MLKYISRKIDLFKYFTITLFQLFISARIHTFYIVNLKALYALHTDSQLLLSALF